MLLCQCSLVVRSRFAEGTMGLLGIITEVFKSLGGYWSLLGIVIFGSLGNKMVISCEPITTTLLGVTSTRCLETTLWAQGAALGAILGFLVAYILHKRGE